MNFELEDLINESIRLEKNVGQLYKFFHLNFPEDQDFWWQIYMEEQNHASLIAGMKHTVLIKKDIPEELFDFAIDDLRATNLLISKLIENYKSQKPERAETFKTAWKLENTAGEMHIQNIAESQSDFEMIKIFQKLNADDKDHALRIKAYAKKVLDLDLN